MPADSREHKFKAGDLRRHYGKTTPLTYGTDASLFELTNLKDRRLSFEPVICRLCNGTRTQPHDEAYATYSRFVDENYHRLEKERRLNFEWVYGRNWSIGKRNLYRYFAKHAGCKIMTGEYPMVPHDIVDFINGSNEVRSLLLHFRLKEGIKILVDTFADGEEDGYAHFLNGHTTCFKAPEDGGMSHFGWSSYQWLTVTWVVCEYVPIHRRPDFDSACEPLEFMSFAQCDSFSGMKEFTEAMMNIEYAGLKTPDERMGFVKSLLAQG
jgi:hypothetical protein